MTASADPDKLLAQYLQAVAPLPKNAHARISAYFRLLLLWNASINLTGARNLNELIEHHLPDSIALSQLVPCDTDLVDVGSGGGLPAIPFALLRPDVRVTLVEPRAKRAAFLRAAAREIPIEDIAVLERRMEAVTGSFDVASSMATFAPEEWVARAPRLVRPGGQAIVFLRQAEALPASSLVVKELNYGTPERPRLAVSVRVGA